MQYAFNKECTVKSILNTLKAMPFAQQYFEDLTVDPALAYDSEEAIALVNKYIFFTMKDNEQLVDFRYDPLTGKCSYQTIVDKEPSAF